MGEALNQRHWLGLPLLALPPSIRMPGGDGPSMLNIPHPILPMGSSSRNAVQRQRAKTSPCHHQEPSTSPRALGHPSPPPSLPQKVQHGGAHRVLARQESGTVGGCKEWWHGPFLPCHRHWIEPQGVTSALPPVDLEMGITGAPIMLALSPCRPRNWGP